MLRVSPHAGYVAVLDRAVLDRAVLDRAVLCSVMQCYTVQCYVVLYRAMLCSVRLPNACFSFLAMHVNAKRCFP